MPITKIDGKLVGVYVSENLTNPTSSDWKELVCSTDLSLEITSNTTSVATRCGTLKSKGVPSISLPIAGVANVTPDAGQISADELLGYVQDGTDLMIKLEHMEDDTLYYRQGQGFLSGYTETIPAEGLVGFSGTIEIDGFVSVTSTKTTREGATKEVKAARERKKEAA